MKAVKIRTQDKKQQVMIKCHLKLDGHLDIGFIVLGLC